VPFILHHSKFGTALINPKDKQREDTMVETYSHLSPLGRINKIEWDIVKERRDATAEFRASVLLAQSSLARLGWEFKELRLSCSNKERSIIKRRHEERLATAKVTWNAAKHESRSAFRAAENACKEAAGCLAERAQAADYELINSTRLVKTKAEKKSARRRCKSALNAAENAYRTEVGLAEEEQKGALSRPRQDVCNNWDGSKSRLELVLDHITSSGHASMERMESINKRMGRAQTLSLSCHKCSSEDDIAEMMEEERQLCQGALTDIRRMQLASSSGKAPLASRWKKDKKTIQRGKAIAEARQKLRILGRYKKDRDATRGKCRMSSKGWSSKSGAKGKGRRRKSYLSQGPTCSHSSPRCDCCYCFCTRRLEGNDRGQELASSSQLALAQSYFANAEILTKLEQHAPDASSLCFLFLAISLICRSLSSLLATLEDNEMKAKPKKTAVAALPSGKFITCMGLVFFAALPLPFDKSLTLESATSDAVVAAKAKIEGKEVDVNGPTTDEVAPRSNQSIIFVKSPDGRLITVPFHPLKKISDVKCEIEHRLGLDPRDYSLCIHLWKKLDRDNLSLSDYGICSGSTLVANMPIRAGMVGGDKEQEEECKHLCKDQPITSPLFHKFGIPYQDKEYDCWQPQAEEAHGPYPSSLFYGDEDNKQSRCGLCPEQACLRDGECYPKEVAAAVPVLPMLLGSAGRKQGWPAKDSASSRIETSKKRKEAEQTTESSREEQRESTAPAAAKPAGSNEAEDSRIGSPRGATNLKLTAAEEIALPMDDEMGEIQGEVRLPRRKLTPSKKKLKNAEIASPVLRSAGKRRGRPKGKRER